MMGGWHSVSKGTQVVNSKGSRQLMPAARLSQICGELGLPPSTRCDATHAKPGIQVNQPSVLVQHDRQSSETAKSLLDTCNTATCCSNV